MSAEILAWHFLKGDMLRDGTKPPADGEWLKHPGPIEICVRGLHASERLIDALDYAPGGTLCRVACRGIVSRHMDKFVCRERKIIWRCDAIDRLGQFANRCALDVAGHWPMPDIVTEYLTTNDINKATAAYIAASREMGTHVDSRRDPVSAAWHYAARAAVEAAGYHTGATPAFYQGRPNGAGVVASSAARATAAWETRDIVDAPRRNNARNARIGDEYARYNGWLEEMFLAGRP